MAAQDRLSAARRGRSTDDSSRDVRRGAVGAVDGGRCVVGELQDLRDLKLEHTHKMNMYIYIYTYINMLCIYVFIYVYVRVYEGM